MTDITELAQSLKAEDISSERMEWLKKLADMEYCANNPGHWLMNLKETNYLASLALQCLESNSTLVAALEKSQQRIAELESRTVKLPDDEDGQAYGFGKWSNGKLPATAGTMTISYCEDAWRTAFEVFSSAAGIKVEAK